MKREYWCWLIGLNTAALAGLCGAGAIYVDGRPSLWRWEAPLVTVSLALVAAIVLQIVVTLASEEADQWGRERLTVTPLETLLAILPSLYLVWPGIVVALLGASIKVGFVVYAVFALAHTAAIFPTLAALDSREERRQAELNAAQARQLARIQRIKDIEVEVLDLPPMEY